MKAIHPILVGFAIICAVHAQNGESAEPDLSDDVAKAIAEFNRLKSQDKEAENEVVVVLPPPEQPAAAEPAEEPAPVDASEKPEESIETPVLITGKPPVDEPEEAAPLPPPVPEPEPSPEPIPEEKQGIEVRVESIRQGTGKTDPSQVKLKASFPAKSLSPTPDGWILEKSGQAPAYTKEVTLRPGTTISLSIQPHVLTPAADGANTFAVPEPGFAAAEGYRQSNTVSAILGNSVAQLDRDALLLGNAISDLHQLLSSLPKPEPQPEDIAKPKKP